MVDYRSVVVVMTVYKWQWYGGMVVAIVVVWWNGSGSGRGMVV